MEYLKYYNKNIGTFLKHLITAPIIYSVFFCFIILDIWVEIYHRICFPLYGIELVDRNKYIKFDRHRLPYLSFVQKFNCAYCAYGNGLIAYVREIVAQTEIYWCGIQHEKDPNFVPPEHHKNFIAYADEKAFVEKYATNEKDCKLFH